MHVDGDSESGHAGATDGTVPKMAVVDRAVGKRSSRASKRGTRTTAAGVTGDGNGGIFDQTSGATGPESNPQRGAYHPTAAGLSQKKYLLKKN